MTTSQPESLWTDIVATEDELPDQQAWRDWSGGRRGGKIKVAALTAALAIPAGAAAIATIGLANAQPAYASSGGGTTATSGGDTTTSSGGGTTVTSGGGTTATSGGGTTATSGGGTTATSGGGTTASSAADNTGSSASGTTGSSASGGTTSSSAGGTTASNPGPTASGNGTTMSGNGTTVGAAARGIVTAGDGTGQQGGPPAQQPSSQDGAPPNPPAQQPGGQDGAPPAEQGQQPATTAANGTAANPAPSGAAGWGVHAFGFGGPAVEGTVGLPGPVSPHVGAWGFGGVYGEIGFSNIGTPNATFDIGHGYLAGGGAVVGVDGVPAVGTVDVEGGALWETGKTDYSLPLGSGTTGQNANQWSAWSPNYYGGLVVGNHEVGGLYGCDSQTCTLTLFYGRALSASAEAGPFTGKVQAWGGVGGSVTWPSTWRLPSW